MGRNKNYKTDYHIYVNSEMAKLFTKFEADVYRITRLGDNHKIHGIKKSQIIK